MAQNICASPAGSDNNQISVHQEIPQTEATLSFQILRPSTPQTAYLSLKNNYQPNINQENPPDTVANPIVISESYLFSKRDDDDSFTLNTISEDICNFKTVNQTAPQTQDLISEETDKIVPYSDSFTLTSSNE